MKTNCVLANIAGLGGVEVTRLLMIADDSDSRESVTEPEESIDFARQSESEVCGPDMDQIKKQLDRLEHMIKN